LHSIQAGHEANQAIYLDTPWAPTRRVSPPGREDGHSCPSRAEVKIARSYAVI